MGVPEVKERVSWVTQSNHVEPGNSPGSTLWGAGVGERTAVGEEGDI